MLPQDTSIISTILIRKYRAEDRGAVRKITFDNAFMGEPASVFFDGESLISSALTGYFTDYEPQSSFVAEDKGIVVGCLIGAKDKAVSEKITSSKVLPGLIKEAFKVGVFFRKKNILFFSNLIISFFKGEFFAPDFSKDYPATFHINIKKEFHGLKIGAKLVDAYLSYLKEEKVTGVHLATMSAKAGEFFTKQGFQLLYTGKRSYFRHVVNKDVPLFIFGRKLA